MSSFAARCPAPHRQVSRGRRKLTGEATSHTKATRKELAGGAKTYRVEFAFFVVDVDERRDIVNDDVVLARGPLAVQKRCAAA